MLIKEDSSILPDEIEKGKWLCIGNRPFDNEDDTWLISRNRLSI